jgi:hypothetical protein
VIVDNAGKTHERVLFGATVTFEDKSGDEREVTIVGVDELDPGNARVSWRRAGSSGWRSSRSVMTICARPECGKLRPRGPAAVNVTPRSKRHGSTEKGRNERQAKRGSQEDREEALITANVHGAFAPRAVTQLRRRQQAG